MCHKLIKINRNGESEKCDGTQSARFVNKSFKLLINLKIKSEANFSVQISRKKFFLSTLKSPYKWWLQRLRC